MKKTIMTMTVLFALAMVYSVPSSAAVIGTLATGICADGGVTVTATTIDWLQPAGGGNGCIQAANGTNLTYNAGAPLPVGTLGTIRDLPIPAGPGSDFPTNPIPMFMSFPVGGGLNFTLTDLGPGVPNTACANVLSSAAGSCSVFAGSPFILIPSSSKTTVSLDARGTIVDPVTGETSAWAGGFSADFAGQTPRQLQIAICGAGPGCAGGGSITSGHSGNFVATVIPTNEIPEPGTVTLLGLGFGFIALAAARRRA